MITAVTSERYVLVAFLRSVSPEKFPVGSRSYANTAEVRCRKSGNMTAKNIGTAIRA